MKHTVITHRPAIAAIAAVMVLATPAGAQELAPSIPAEASAQPAPTPELPPVVAPEVSAATPAPAPEAPAAPVYSAPTAVVQSVPEPQAQAAPAPARQANMTPRPAAKAVTPAPVAAKTNSIPVTPTEPVVVPPEASIAVPPPVPLETAQPVATTPNAVSDNDLTYGVIGGGALLVLLGAGTAFAMRRGRRQAQPVAVKRAAPFVAEPVLAPEPAPRAKAHMARAATDKHSAWPELEDMVAAKPDAANPFLTRSKRLRRAEFLLAHGEPQLHTAVETKAEPKTAKAPARAKQTESKPQPAYNFSSTRLPGRVTWKPAMT